MPYREPISRAKTGFDKLFADRSSSLYDSMANRKIVKQRGGLPFTRDEFREWLLAQLGDKQDGVVQCVYCTEWLNIATITPDHRLPLARGGSAALDNLDPCCKSCNLRKGKLTPEGFRALIKFVTETMDRYDASDIFSRLATGGEGAKMMWKRKSSGRPQPSKGTMF